MMDFANRQRGNGSALVGLLVFAGIAWGIVSFFSKKQENEYGYTPPASVYSVYNTTYNTYDGTEEVYPVGFEGTDYMEACNGNTGNCYDLEIDSDGENIERINFPNGGWRDVDYSDCDNGYCIVEDEDGTEWELQY